MTAGTIHGSHVDWGTGEERARRIAQLTRKDLKRRIAANPRSLLDALDGSGSISRRELRDIARPYDVPVVSLYLGFAADPSEPPIPVLQPFHSMRHEEISRRSQDIERLEPAMRRRLERDLEELEAFLQELTPPDGMRSLVVFKEGEELNRVVAVNLRMRDRLVIDPDPYVMPLDVVLETHPRVLLAVVEKDHAHLAVHHLGREQDVDKLRSFVPDDMVDKSRPGQVQRHRLTHRHWHLRAVQRAIERTFEGHECDAIVLAGDERILDVSRELLPEQWRARVIGEFHPSQEDTRAEREAKVEEIVARHRAGVEAAACENLPQLRAYERLVSGLRDVLDATNQFQVRRLVLRDDLELAGFACREHHFLSLDAGDCPFDSEPLLAVENVVDELVELARQHGVALTFVAQRHDLLEPYAGVAGELYPPA